MAFKGPPLGIGLPIGGAVRSGRRQAGQVIIILAAMIIVLFGGMGLAVDGAILYFYNVGAGRAAEAAALAGVVFMPSQFSSGQAFPAGSGNDASDRAIAEAGKNGFQDGVNSVVITPATVAGQPNQLSVTVSTNVPSFFMKALGFGTGSVKRTAIALYQPPTSLGQPGNQLGATVAELGTTNPYFMRVAGHGWPLEFGDPFSVGQTLAYYGPPSTILNPAAKNLHKISASNGTDTVDATLPAIGGYNYFINLPAGGYIQVYNAAFAPDGNGENPWWHNYCDNVMQGWPLVDCNQAAPAPAGGPPPVGTSQYFYHEDNWQCPATAPGCAFDLTRMMAMEYTVFKVNSPYFIRSDDTKISQMVVYPIDATNWHQSPPYYCLENAGLPCVGPRKITQIYDGLGNPTNMQVYHNWADVSSLPINPDDKGVVAYRLGPLAPKLPAGTYRLRVDSLERDGSVSTAAGTAFGGKGYAVRVVDTAGGTTCAGCTLNAWDDMDIYTPFTLAVGGNFSIPLFQAPPTYAGLTADVWIFDPGDVQGGGSITLDIIDAATGLTATAGAVPIYDTGNDMYGAPVLVSNTTKASIVATSPCPCPPSDPPPSGSGYHYNGHWLDFHIPISAGYNPGVNPNNWWWKLKYTTTAGTNATDTIGVVVVLQGTPVHLVSG